MTEEQVRGKIKEMFDAVFGETIEDRNDFLRLSKASQDMLIASLRDNLIDGQVALLKDLKIIK